LRTVDVCETTLPISSPIRNAPIDFSRITLSLVAVITDVQVDRRPVVGYGLHADGRYGQGPLLRDRSLPRLLAAEPDALLDERGVLDPHPDLCKPFGGFPDGVEVEDGHVTIPDLAGIGVQGKGDLIPEMRALSE
jgi:hypothetical protein